MEEWDQDFQHALIDAENYREFLKVFFARSTEARNPRPMSFQVFANRSGFSSKSYMNEVLSKRRRLTPASFEKVVSGLGLSMTWAEYLRCLIALEEASFRSKSKNVDYFQRRLRSERKKLRSAATETWISASSVAAKVSLQENVTEICVAAGAPDVGASFDEIRLRTKLSRARLEERLAMIVSAGLLKKNSQNDRYYNTPPAANALHSYGDIEYQRYIAARAKAALEGMSRPSGEHCLFATQTFLVKKNSLKKLSQELNRIVREFADEADDDHGDGIAEVLVTLTHNFD